MRVEMGLLPNVFLLHANIDEAQAEVEKALSAVGFLKTSIRGQITGGIRYGLNPVAVTLTLVEKDNQTQLTIQARNQSIYTKPNRSAIERLTEALLNSGASGYIPDKSGISKIRLAMTILLALFLFAVLWGSLFSWLVTPLF